MTPGAAATIAQAQGVLMARHAFDSTEAIVWLRSQADDLRLDLDHVAEGVVLEVDLRNRTD